MEVGKAIKRPFTSLTKFLIGFALGIIPVVNFFTMGYILYCGKTAMEKDYKLPEWKKFLNFFVKGFFATLITLIYFIPALILLYVALVKIFFENMLIDKSTLITQSTLSSSISLSLPLILIAIILMIIAAYISPIATLSYINKGKFKEAFRLKFIFKKAFTGKYFVTWLLVGLYTLFVMLILNFISSVNIYTLFFIPWIVGGLTSFITGVTFYTAIGRIYHEI